MPNVSYTIKVEGQGESEMVVIKAAIRFKCQCQVRAGQHTQSVPQCATDCLHNTNTLLVNFCNIPREMRAVQDEPCDISEHNCDIRTSGKSGGRCGRHCGRVAV